MATLYVVATPIGNLEDITVRAIKTILATPIIACEDTRRTGQLIKILADRYPEYAGERVPKKLVSIRDWNEKAVVDQILAYLESCDVALVSDAGTPLISDPGFKLVRKAREMAIKVEPIPGVSALTTALSGAGLPTNRFIFWGFWEKKYELLPEATNVFYEAPTRLVSTLENLKERYPSAQIVIANELTKMHEEFINVNEENWEKISKLKGEATILVYI